MSREGSTILSLSSTTIDLGSSSPVERFRPGSGPCRPPSAPPSHPSLHGKPPVLPPKREGGRKVRGWPSPSSDDSIHGPFRSDGDGSVLCRSLFKFLTSKRPYPRLFAPTSKDVPSVCSGVLRKLPKRCPLVLGRIQNFVQRPTTHPLPNFSSVLR